MDYFFTIEKESTNEFKDRGSRFIATAFPLEKTDDFKLRLNAIKKEHPKAVHHCFAYRIGLTGDIFRVSDDGEPSGSAGKPILGQIDSKKVINTAIVVTRYFGGTLLGVPGLINAYKTASSLVLQTIPIIQKPVMISYYVSFDYSTINEIMQVLKQCQCEIRSTDINLFSGIAFNVPKIKEDEALFRLKEIKGVELKKISLS